MVIPLAAPPQGINKVVCLSNALTQKHCSAKTDTRLVQTAVEPTSGKLFALAATSSFFTPRCAALLPGVVTARRELIAIEERLCSNSATKKKTREYDF